MSSDTDALIVADKTSFVTKIRADGGTGLADAYGDILNELIAFSNNDQRLKFRPNTEKKGDSPRQETVAFQLAAEQGDVVWQAYPDQNPKIVLMEGNAERFRPQIEWLLSELRARKIKTDDGDIVTIRFADIGDIGFVTEAIKGLLDRLE